MYWATGKTLANPLGTALTFMRRYVPPSANPGTIKTGAANRTAEWLDGQLSPSILAPNCGAVDNQEGYTDCPDSAELRRI